MPPAIASSCPYRAKKEKIEKEKKFQRKANSDATARGQNGDGDGDDHDRYGNDDDDDDNIGNADHAAATAFATAVVRFAAPAHRGSGGGRVFQPLVHPTELFLACPLVNVQSEFTDVG